MRTAISHDAVAQGRKIIYILTYRRFTKQTNLNLSFTLAGLRPAASEGAKSPGFIVSRFAQQKKLPPWRELPMFERPPE